MSAAAQESDGSATESIEVHATGDWALVVRADGAVEARTYWDNGDLRAFTTAPTAEAPSSGATYRYGKSIEKVLARYAHETRFDRDAEEHGAALRNGIIEALCALAPTTSPGGTGDRLTGVIHVNAPTGPSTYLAGEDASAAGTYATFHPFADSGEQ
jgi:hypothetical protein